MVLEWSMSEVFHDLGIWCYVKWHLKKLSKFRVKLLLTLHQTSHPVMTSCLSWTALFKGSTNLSWLTGFPKYKLRGTGCNVFYLSNCVTHYTTCHSPGVTTGVNTRVTTLAQIPWAGRKRPKWQSPKAQSPLSNESVCSCFSISHEYRNKTPIQFFARYLWWPSLKPCDPKFGVVNCLLQCFDKAQQITFPILREVLHSSLWLRE